MKRFGLFFFFIFVFLFSAIADESKIFESAIKHAISNDRSVFVDDYLFEKFRIWHQKFPISSFKIDTILDNNLYQEIRIEATTGKKNLKIELALLLTRSQNPRIVDVRKIIVFQRNSFNADEIEVIQFIEKLVWIYEIGNDGFLHDFLYPDYVLGKYDNAEDNKEIVNLLRKQFVTTLPVKSIEWERNQAIFDISVKLDSPFEPLLLHLDIERYISSQFFETEDKAQRTSSLADSIQYWLKDYQNHLPEANLIESASSSTEALQSFIQNQFAEYNISVTSKLENSITIEANLIPIGDLQPVSLRYHLTSQKIGKDKYQLFAEWLPANSQTAEKSGIRMNDSPVVEAFNETLQRFSAAGLSPILQKIAEKGERFSASLVIQGYHSVSVKFMDLQAYTFVLNHLAGGMTSSFFPRDVSLENKTMLITGYVILQNNRSGWRHMIKVKEVFLMEGDSFRLTDAKLDLFPFLRIENIKVLFAIQNNESPGTKKVIIKK